MSTPVWHVSVGRHGVVVLACMIACIWNAGCGGWVRTSLVNLETSSVSIEPVDTNVITENAGQCYYWQDHAGRLIIAWRHDSESMVVPGRQRMDVSIVLPEATAGVGRNYQILPDMVRGMYKVGPSTHRFRGYFGVVSVENRDDGSLRGAFRVRIGLQRLTWVSQWASPVPCLLFGQFHAVKNRAACGDIVRSTEADGFDRETSVLQELCDE